MDLKASCADLSKYVCFVCGCALAARVLAPLRLDEELWWFYVLACGGVLFGPLVRQYRIGDASEGRDSTHFYGTV